MIKYKIEGQYLDQFQDEQFAVTKAISKIGEIDLRHGDFSTTFKVPLTAKNVEILRYTPELNNRSNLDNFKRYDGQLVEDDAVISDGYYQVTGFNPTKREASIKFLGGNSDWFDLLKDRYINEEYKASDGFNNPYYLDFLEHDYTSDSIINSWNDFENYFYYLFDNGQNSGQTITSNTNRSDWNVGYFKHSILKNIFDSVDIKTQGSLFSDPEFINEVISGKSSIEEVINKDDRTSTFLMPQDVYEISNEGQGWTKLNFTEGTYNSQWDGNKFTAANDINDLKIYVTINCIPNSLVSDLKVRYRKNGGAWQTPVSLPLIVNAGDNQTYSAYLYNSFFTGVLVGDSFEFEFAFVGAVQTTYFARGGASSSFRFIEEGVFGKVQASGLMPNIKQTDFIKDIMFRFGVVSQYDVKTKTLTLDKFENIDTNRILAPDWTNKIDLSKDVDVDYTKILSNYGKRSVFSYEDDENDSRNIIFKSAFTYVFGSGIINIDNDFLSDEKEVYKSPFASTLNEYTFGAKWYLPFIPYQKIESGSTYEAQEVKARLLKVYKLPVSSFNNDSKTSLTIDFSASQDEVGYAFMGKTILVDVATNELNAIYSNSLFGNIGNQMTGSRNTLIDRNYNLYQKILNDPIYVSLYMNLTALDVQQVDFLTPIYLEYQYDSGYYYIDSIDQYKGDGTTTKINLVKI